MKLPGATPTKCRQIFGALIGPESCVQCLENQIVPPRDGKAVFDRTLAQADITVKHLLHHVDKRLKCLQGRVCMRDD